VFCNRFGTSLPTIGLSLIFRRPTIVDAPSFDERRKRFMMYNVLELMRSFAFSDVPNSRRSLPSVIKAAGQQLFRINLNMLEMLITGQSSKRESVIKLYRFLGESIENFPIQLIKFASAFQTYIDELLLSGVIQDSPSHDTVQVAFECVQEEEDKVAIVDIHFIVDFKAVGKYDHAREKFVATDLDGTSQSDPLTKFNTIYHPSSMIPILSTPQIRRFYQRGLSKVLLPRGGEKYKSPNDILNNETLTEKSVKDTEVVEGKDKLPE
jgi:hypothetical protein